MILKTKNLEMFKIINYNRDIKEAEYKKVRDSIKSKNMLSLRPINVTRDMQVIDGQHRLRAAKELGLEIYYVIKEDFVPEDIIALNIQKPWMAPDYFKFYVTNKYPDYIKLDKFIKKHGITLIIALSMCIAGKHERNRSFREGTFKFLEESHEEQISKCMDIISLIQHLKGVNNSFYTRSGRFWSAVITMVRHPDFDFKLFKEKSQYLPEKFGPRASTEAYIEMFESIYNYKQRTKLSFE